MSEPDPFADDPHDVIGVEPGATVDEIRVAAGKAKRMYNPESHPKDEREAAREAFYSIKDAEAELLEGARRGDTPRALDLSVPSEVETGEMEVRVRDGGGAPVEGIAVVVARTDDRGDERTATTDEEGYAAVSVPTAGEYEVTASVEMVVERATVTVEPRVVEPDVALDDDWVVGEPATVAVSVEGEPVAGALVGVGDDREETDVNGLAEFRPKTAGEKPVTVIVDNTDSRTVCDWTGDIEVARAVAGLTVDVDDPAAAWTKTKLRVTADGDPVDGAVVGSLDDRLVAETRDGDQPETVDGTAAVQFTEPGDATVYADREADADREYRRDETHVSVWPAEPTATVAASSSRLAVGQSVTLSVTREFDGEPVCEETVTIERDGERVMRTKTDDRGEVTFTPTEPGEHTVRVAFEAPTGVRGEATTAVSVDDREVPELKLHDGTQVEPGEGFSCQVVGRESGDPIQDINVKMSRVRDGAGMPGDSGVEQAEPSGWVEFDAIEAHDSAGPDYWQVWAAQRPEGLNSPDAHPLNSNPLRITVPAPDPDDRGLIDPGTVERLIAGGTAEGSVGMAVIGIATFVAALYVDSLGATAMAFGGVLVVTGSSIYLLLMQ